MLVLLREGPRRSHAATRPGEAAATPFQKKIAANVPHQMLVRLEEVMISPKVTNPATTKKMLPPTPQNVNISKNPRA